MVPGNLGSSSRKAASSGRGRGPHARSRLVGPLPRPFRSEVRVAPGRRIIPRPPCLPVLLPLHTAEEEEYGPVTEFRTLLFSPSPRRAGRAPRLTRPTLRPERVEAPRHDRRRARSDLPRPLACAPRPEDRDLSAPSNAPPSCPRRSPPHRHTHGTDSG